MSPSGTSAPLPEPPKCGEGNQYEEGDSRREGYYPWWAEGNFEKNATAVEQLTELAAERGVTTSQLALAWVLAQGQHVVPNPGSRNPKRVQENIAAADLSLTSTDLARIREILPHGAQGARIAGNSPTWI
ncbi:aldo/keto reductase [Streptomyces globisporus]|uniref:aldo/keto reductase n=1 Tax=Streptomyces globisporus TaxID=1908 RepID=UPI00386C543E|nr:aldo/keto reductase [Streptomyces globisporus]